MFLLFQVTSLNCFFFLFFVWPAVQTSSFAVILFFFFLIKIVGNSFLPSIDVHLDDLYSTAVYGKTLSIINDGIVWAAEKHRAKTNISKASFVPNDWQIFVLSMWLFLFFPPDDQMKQLSFTEIQEQPTELTALYTLFTYVLYVSMKVQLCMLPLSLSERWGWLLTALGSPCVAQRVWAMPKCVHSSSSRSSESFSGRMKQII